MSSIPDKVQVDFPIYLKRFQRLPEGKVRLSAPQLRHHLRWRLLEYLRRQLRFQNIIKQDLQEPWRALRNHLGQYEPWKDVPEDSPYATKLSAFVGEELRLREHGRPSWYFLCEIHDMVSRGARLPQPAFIKTFKVQAELHLEVDTKGDAQIAQVTADAVGQAKQSVRFVGGPYAAFADWDGLRAQAHADLDAVIDTMQDQFTNATKEFRAVRTSRLNEIEEEDLAELINFLWNRKTIPSRRDTRRRLLKDLGLDQVRN